MTSQQQAQEQYKKHMLRERERVAAATRHLDAENVGAISASAAEETDPYGYGQHAPGAKVDAGKARAGLVLGDFPRALLSVAEVGTFGARKYSDHGWLSVPDGINRYEDACWRHYLKEKAGEELDNDSGIEHASHMAWNALAVLELKLRKKNGL